MAETIEQMKRRAEANQEVYQYNSDKKRVWPVKDTDAETIARAKISSQEKRSNKANEAAEKTHAKNLKSMGTD